MTDEEADRRIIVSRQTLHRYKAAVAAGMVPVQDMGLMNDELDLLERIADQCPAKRDKIIRLGEEWLSLMAGIRTKLN